MSVWGVLTTIPPANGKVAAAEVKSKESEPRFAEDHLKKEDAIID